MPYSVTLRNFADLDADDRRGAETRYRSALEDAFGDPADVAAAVAAWNLCTVTRGAMSSERERVLAVRFFKTSIEARQAALRRAGDPAQAYFEVSLNE